MPISSFDEIYFTCLFLLGGYISQSIVEKEYPLTDDNSSHVKLLLQYLFLSLFIFIISYPLIIFLIRIFEIDAQLELLLATLLPIFLISYCTEIARREILRYRLKANKPIKSLMTAWDRAFYNITPIVIKVKLKSGDEMYGYLDSSSYISDSRYNDPDLLFTLCFIDEESNLVKMENTSILIMRSNIEYIKIIEKGRI